MGCCLTTAAAGDDSKPTSKPHGSPPPPQPPPEEETVKEVLSETPLISIKPPPTKITGENQQILHPVEEFRSPNDVVGVTNNKIEENDVASEVSSEMYTYSESFSAATTTTSFATDLKRNEIGNDEDGEVNQKVKKKRPPEKMAPRKHPPSPASSVRRKERGIGPPARRSAIASRNVTTAERRRNVMQSNVVRRDPPTRRSRSPAVRREEGQLRKVKERSPVSNSGKRFPVNTTENEGNLKLKKNTAGGVVPSPSPSPETETLESLENPLVSLECFIFL